MPLGYRHPSCLNSRIEFYEEYGKKAENTSGKKWYPWVTDHIKSENNDRILEVGCGSGNLWVDGNWASRPAEEVHITDISDRMVKKARESIGDKIKSLNYEIVDVANIPFPNNYFDVVIANHILHLVEDINKSIKEIKRVLKPTGSFYSTTKHHHNFVGVKNILKEIGIGEDVEQMNKYSINNAGRRLSRHFSDVYQELYLEKYYISKKDIDALVYFAGSKWSLSLEQRHTLRSRLLDQMVTRENATKSDEAIMFKKYLAIMEAKL
ncbi:MAG: class I SAM-dependent methyltransferase [Candidatus Paceibacteria bacterium]